MARAAEIAQDTSVAVNNPGIARVGSVLYSDTSRLRLELETSLFGALAVASAFTGRLVQRSGAVSFPGALLQAHARCQRQLYDPRPP